MPRAIWNGSISFGLVNIPIKLYNAVSRKNVSFHQIDSETGSRVQMKRVSAETGEEVPYERMVKGYELSKDRYVFVEPSELDALDPVASRTVDIEQFIDLADIDPVFFDTPYYVAPTKAAEKPYALLAQAMEKEGKVGIARFVMRTKQYLAAIRPKDGKLLLSTMIYADEVVPAEEVGEFDLVEDVEVSDRELTMAAQLIESLSADFEPDQFRDTYREQVLELIEKKAAGETIELAPPPPDDGKVVDLMAALEASVKEARSARKRHPTGADEGDAAAGDGDEAADDEDEDDAPKRKAAAKKTAAKKSAAKKAPAKRAKKSA